MYVKNTVFGVLLHVLVKMPLLPSNIDDTVITCDEIIKIQNGLLYFARGFVSGQTTIYNHKIWVKKKKYWPSNI